MLDGMMARPAATSDLTNSAVISFGILCGKREKTEGVKLAGWKPALPAIWPEPACCLFKSLRTLSRERSLKRGFEDGDRRDACPTRMFSRMAMNSISGVTMPV